MAIYTIVVKRNNMQYSISGDDKAFITEHISSVFAELKTREAGIGDNSFTKLDLAPTTSTPAQDTKPVKISHNDENDIAENISQNLTDDSYTKEESMEVFEPETNELPKDSSEINPKENEEAEEEIELVEQQETDEVTIQEITEEQTEHRENSPENNEISSVFENILEAKINDNIYVEEKAKQPINYDSIIKNISDKSLINYLIITAYCMLENEQLETFQLKQLNSKLFASMNMVIDRKTIQKALEEDFINIVTAGENNNGIVEYKLTQKGKEYYINAGV